MKNRSTSPTADPIGERLHRLEQSNRRLRVMLLGAGLAAIGLGLAAFNAAQPANREINTQRIVVNGADGQPRIMMQGNDDGGLLVLYGPTDWGQGRQRGRGQGEEEGQGERSRSTRSGGIGGTQGVGGFNTLSPRLRLIVAQENARIELLDPDGSERLVLHLDENGPEIRRVDRDGNEIEE